MKTVLLAAAAALILAMPLGAKAEEAPPLFSVKSLTPEMALELALATQKACRAEGYQTAVAVVDRGGVLQVLLRDRFAGAHTPETARRKAWTALSFRTDTTQMAENTQAGKEASGVRDVPGALMLGGGVMVRAGGELVGAIGVSGAPGGQADEDCAKKGLEGIEDKMPL
ncbi:MAG: heme-binding protein [Rhodospirillales bacterium]|jgi:uncharacterized protein GlcG (DUF336 family)|nr:hypothetical protein [Rhodospirillaceae bacterium]MDP6427636.1 heme-binding protein [Rhodospirillales bacterium]MDP6644822.1 heme-binding protein [Rhodospirillales bacterium]